MTLYLKVGVGNASYLVAAAQVRDVRPADDAGAADAPLFDCRKLFDAPGDAPGYHVVLEAETGVPSLIVDRLDGLVELADEAFRPLPAIGRFGALIDAVSLPVAAEPPALRLRVGGFSKALVSERMA